MRGREQDDLRQKIGPQHSGGFQPQTRRSEQWTVDPFWEVVRPTPAQQQQQQNPVRQLATTSTDQQFDPVPMEESEIDSETDQDPSILESWKYPLGIGQNM